ncbi:hypothetical protein KQX63_02820 [Rhodopseudomonas palustris]|nr:hypothetical protein KQX63_02820 [Rhodopseudomonas palustris]
MEFRKECWFDPGQGHHSVHVGDERETATIVAQAAGICPPTERKWVARFKDARLGGLAHRSLLPRRLYRPGGDR